MNKETTLKWLNLFHGVTGFQPGTQSKSIVEIRVLQSGKTFSGYFKDVDKILETIAQFDGKGGMIYAPINSINEACYSREQHEKMVQNPKQTTNDKDIIHRDFILIDIDPKRPAGVNATDKEKQGAIELGRKIYSFLVDQNGFEKPIVADSGNGVHLYFRVDIPNGDEEKNLCKNFLNELGILFSNEVADVDCSVFNAARISKIIGTVSNKGTSTEERPMRESCFLYVPDEVRITDVSFIKKIADMIPKVERPSAANNYSSEKFDLDKFVSDHGIEVTKRINTGDGVRYVLKECPFDPNHKDAAVFVYNTGAMGFHCFHNSCAHHDFRDFRLHFDPNAYSRETREAVRNWDRFKKPSIPYQEESTELGKKWQQMSEIKYIDTSSLPCIPTGFNGLDKRLQGLILGEVTVLSGTNASGKSSWINNLLANAVQSGYKAAVWSGELQPFRFQSWLLQVLAGKSRVVKKSGFDEVYFVPNQIAKKINAWLDNKLWLYNNAYGNNWEQLHKDIMEIVNEKGVKLVVLDNLTALNLNAGEGDLFRQQSKFITDLVRYTKQANIHVVLVCHPRKEVSFLRKESISGTSNITDLADNVFIIHRVNNDFEKRATEFLGARLVGEIMDEKHFDNVLEVCKNRSGGVIDQIVGLYFEPETRRMKNEKSDYIIYGWDEKPVQQDLELQAQSTANDTPSEPIQNSFDEDLEPLTDNQWWHN